MDSALLLRLAFEANEDTSDKIILEAFEKSTLVTKLTRNYIEHPLFATFRIMGISEIPFMKKLPYTQKLIQYINKNISTEEGFSCLGGVSEIVPCYNAMILEAYTRLGLSESKEAQAALSWIKQYQLFERNQKTTWKHDGVCKHGGCLGKIPCYIGVGKTVHSLITYSEFINKKDKEVETLIEQGVSYMLNHKMYQRLSTAKPISPHITDIMMPQNYALSLTDLVYIVGKKKLVDDTETVPLLDLLKEKQIDENKWKIDYLYSYKGYVGFEARRKASEWVSNLFPIWLRD